MAARGASRFGMRLVDSVRVGQAWQGILRSMSALSRSEAHHGNLAHPPKRIGNAQIRSELSAG